MDINIYWDTNHKVIGGADGAGIETAPQELVVAGVVDLVLNWFNTNWIPDTLSVLKRKEFRKRRKKKENWNEEIHQWYLSIYLSQTSCPSLSTSLPALSLSLFLRLEAILLYLSVIVSLIPSIYLFYLFVYFSVHLSLHSTNLLQGCTARWYWRCDEKQVYWTQHNPL